MIKAKTFSLAWASIGGFIGWYLGGFDDLLYALLAFVVADYITGILCAIDNHRLSSEVGFRGINRKLLIFILVGLANVIDANLLKHGTPIRTATICFYISNEGISLLENAGQLGLPFPKKLKDVLEQLQNNNDKED
ncbi:phage holin family protein [Ligilactobacillus agilis]|uniref:phage holin family protein n=1 Tax=Ligilactobacillus agilis TaxID=1601 RepID=UPI0022E6A004|nr:phage holin family protein [Ligilactobacillus agilis]